jgi:hypothetical protein
MVRRSPAFEAKLDRSWLADQVSSAERTGALEATVDLNHIAAFARVVDGS